MLDLEAVANVAGVVSLVAILALVFHVLRKIKALSTDWHRAPAIISNIRTNVEVLEGQIQQIESLSTEISIGSAILKDAKRAKKKAAESKAHLPCDVGGSSFTRFFRRMEVISFLDFFTELERQTSQWDDRLARHVTDLQLRAWLLAFHEDMSQVEHVAEPASVPAEAPEGRVSEPTRSHGSRPPRSYVPPVNYYAQQRLSQLSGSASEPQRLPDPFGAGQRFSRSRSFYPRAAHLASGPTGDPPRDKGSSSSVRR